MYSQSTYPTRLKFGLYELLREMGENMKYRRTLAETYLYTFLDSRIGVPGAKASLELFDFFCEGKRFSVEKAIMYE